MKSKKQKKIYPSLTIKISEEHRKKYDELKNKYYINISKMLRDTLDNIYNNIKNQENQEDKEKCNESN